MRVRRADGTGSVSTVWEYIGSDVNDDNRVRRLPVPGGWLYQVSDQTRHEGGTVGDPDQWSYGWSAPVFVADAERATAEARSMIEKIASAL